MVSILLILYKYIFNIIFGTSPHSYICKNNAIKTKKNIENKNQTLWCPLVFTLFIFSDHTTEHKKGTDSYLRFTKSGAVGVLEYGKNPINGKEVKEYFGSQLLIVSGVGWTTESKAYNSSKYRGRCSAECGAMMSILSRYPKVPVDGRVFIR